MQKQEPPLKVSQTFCLRMRTPIPFNFSYSEILATILVSLVFKFLSVKMSPFLTKKNGEITLTTLD